VGRIHTHCLVIVRETNVAFDKGVSHVSGDACIADDCSSEVVLHHIVLPSADLL
jgi:hypothetical protein